MNSKAVFPCQRLRSWTELEPAVQRGLRAVSSAHHRLIEDPARYACSVDLDGALHEAEPNAPRWDYILARRDRTSVGMEVHPAKASEVALIIAKKEWAQAKVSVHCQLRIDRWYWVRPAGSPLQFTLLSPKARLLAQSRIHFPVSRLP